MKEYFTANVNPAKDEAEEKDDEELNHEPVESAKWRLLEFSAPITESAEVNNEFIIKGVAISETTTHNNHKYIAEELEKATPSLIGRPLLIDHSNRVEDIKGKVMRSYFDPMQRHIRFEAKIMDPKIKEMVKDGRISNVSIGAYATDLVKEENSNNYIAKGIRIAELSLVAVPADENATFAMAMTKNYQLKESMVKKDVITKIVETIPTQIIERRFNMTEETESKLQEMEVSQKKLLEELNALKAERRSAFVQEYKRLCSEKKVREKDLTSVSEETVKMLIEQLKEIEIKAEVEKKELKSQVTPSFNTEGLTNCVVERMDNGMYSMFVMPDSKGRMKL